MIKVRDVYIVIRVINNKQISHRDGAGCKQAHSLHVVYPAVKWIVVGGGDSENAYEVVVKTISLGLHGYNKQVESELRKSPNVMPIANDVIPPRSRQHCIGVLSLICWRQRV